MKTREELVKAVEDAEVARTAAGDIYAAAKSAAIAAYIATDDIYVAARDALAAYDVRRVDMTEEQFEAAHILKDKISLEIHEIVDAALHSKSPEMDELIRELLNDEFRFW